MKIESGTWDGFMSAGRDDQGALEIDLSELSWVDPVIAAGVAAVAYRANKDGRQVSFIPPTNSSACGYLARMRLGGALQSLGISHGLPTVNERDQEGNLLELREFSSEHDGEQLAELVYTRLKESGKADSQILGPLHGALIELATNTSIHAGVDHGFAIAQTYPNKRQIMFCVADAGKGLKASLDENKQLHPDDDVHALEMAVIRQFSGTEDPHRGYGLPEVVDSVRSLGGTTQIASGSAAARFEQKPDPEEATDIRYTSSLSSAYNGVIVQVTIPWALGR